MSNNLDSSKYKDLCIIIYPLQCFTNITKATFTVSSKNTVNANKTTNIDNATKKSNIDC